MINSLAIALQMALEKSAPSPSISVRVQNILDRPFLATVENHGLSDVLTESQLPAILDRYSVPEFFRAILNDSRIVAYAQGNDKHGLGRVAFVYYDSDDKLVLTDIQNKIPQTQYLTQEGVEDVEVYALFLKAGFLPYLPAGAYPLNEEL